MNKLFPLISFIATLVFFSCTKNSFITSKQAIVNFSSDSLFFDTVFTTTGSITQSVKIFNANNQRLLLSDVKLMGGAASFFAINIDGSPGPEQKNVEIEARDSLYIFVTVRIDPVTGNLPFVINDSILVAYNGIREYIQLQAWGQNANFLRNQVIKTNTIWNDSLPYVILGGLQVDTNATLTIPQGCKVYFHADAPMLVDGTLQVQGDKYDSTRVLFLGDRLDAPYNSFPGSWPGIYFRGPSINNSLVYAVLKNAYQGIVAEMPATNANPKVLLNDCILSDIYDGAIIGDLSSIQATNCLVSNCGKNIELVGGGNYQFIHCTVASFSNSYIFHTQPVLYVSNYLQGNVPGAADLNAVFSNCIFWGDFGNVNDEVVVSRQGSTVFSVNFANCLWKVKNAPGGIAATNMVTNLDPTFDSVNTNTQFYDFHLKAGSPAIDKGAATAIPFDLDGNPRTVGAAPDLGCYEAGP